VLAPHTKIIFSDDIVHFTPSIRQYRPQKEAAGLPPRLQTAGFTGSSGTILGECPEVSYRKAAEICSGKPFQPLSKIFHFLVAKQLPLRLLFEKRSFY